MKARERNTEEDTEDGIESNINMAGVGERKVKFFGRTTRVVNPLCYCDSKTKLKI